MRRNLLDVRQAADLLHVPASRVRRLVAEQAIPFVMVGPFVRFDPDTLRTWHERLAAVELREPSIDLRDEEQPPSEAADHTRKV